MDAGRRSGHGRQPRRRPSRRAACLGVLALFPLAACTHTPEPVQTLPVKTLSPPPTVTPSPSGTTPTVKLLYIGDTAGPVQDEPGFRGAQLAVDQANEGGFGPLRVNIELVPVALQGGSIEVITAVGQTVTDPTVVGAVGPTASRAVLAVGPLLNRVDLPFVTFATDPTLGTQGWTHFFRAVADDNTISAAMSLYIGRVVKPTCAYLVSDGTPYGSNLAAGVATALPGEGVPAEPPEADVVSADDAAAVAKRVKASGCKAVFYGGHGGAGARLAAALRTGGSKDVTFLGADGLVRGPFRSIAGSSAKGAIAACACDAGVAEATAGSTERFAASYEDRYGVPPEAFAAEAWDAVQMYVAALKGGVDERERIARFIRALNHFPGLTKSYTYGSAGGGSLAPPTAVFLYMDDGDRWVPMGSAGQFLGG